MVSEENRQVAWGVLGSAWINEMAIPGLQRAPHARLAAVSSRRPGMAESDRERWGAESAYDSYEALLADENVDAVYVPFPNHAHAEWVVRALEAGKHVLCEKPLVLSSVELDRIEAAAAASGKLVLEAFMYRFAPRWQRMLDLIGAGAIGDPRLVRVIMGFKQHYDDYNIRFDPAAGGGAMWDLGCYATNMSRLIFGSEPESVFATSWNRPDEAVDTTTTAILSFAEGKAAMFSVSFDFVNPHAQIEVVGTDGWIEMQGTSMRGEPFTRLAHHRFGDELFLDGREAVTEEFPWSDSFAGEFEHMSRAILGLEELRYGLPDARANITVLERLIESSGAGRAAEL